MSDRTPPAPVPVTVICGFLGAGKTTLLQRVLEAPDGVRFGVLVNDFGAINIDAALIVETGADQVALSNGCICCSIRDDLVEAADRILSAEPPPDRLIVEASGVSRPLAILEALSSPQLAGRLVVDATVCLVDADQFPGLDYASTELAIDQAVSSDLLILNKCDLARPEDIAATEATLTGPLPDVRRIRTAFAHVPSDILFGIGEDAAKKLPSASGAHHHAPHAHGSSHGHDHQGHDHTDEFETWSWESAAPLDLDVFRAVARQLPSSLLRAKGIVHGLRDGVGHRVVFHLVGKRTVVTETVGAPPATSQLIVIARKGRLDRPAIASLINGCLVR